MTKRGFLKNGDKWLRLELAKKKALREQQQQAAQQLAPDMFAPVSTTIVFDEDEDSHLSAQARALKARKKITSQG